MLDSRPPDGRQALGLGCAVESSDPGPHGSRHGRVWLVGLRVGRGPLGVVPPPPPGGSLCSLQVAIAEGEGLGRAGDPEVLACGLMRILHAWDNVAHTAAVLKHPLAHGHSLMKIPPRVGSAGRCLTGVVRSSSIVGDGACCPPPGSRGGPGRRCPCPEAACSPPGCLPLPGVHASRPGPP